MAHRAVGIDQLAPRQALQRVVQSLVQRDRRQVDLVHEFQEILGLHAVMDHEAVEGGLMVAEILFLQGARRLRLEIKKLLDIFPDPALDLVEQAAGGRIKRVIQVENPASGVGRPHKTIVIHSGGKSAGTLRTLHLKRKSWSDA
jgi:hypothetical protein